MIQFADYHRTIVGYHGTRLSTALNIVNRRESFNYSRDSDDWLGHGIYFWEYAPQQALWWARRRQKRQNWGEPVAVLAAMIRLGFCFDLLDPYNVEYLKSVYARYLAAQALIGATPPRNANHHKYLDCAVFQYGYNLIAQEESRRAVDSARAVYVPSGKGKRVWTRSWISNGAHIQLCVRNPECILGTWLHSLTPTETADGESEDPTAPERVEPPHREGGQANGANDPSGPCRPDGEGRTDDAGGG